MLVLRANNSFSTWFAQSCRVRFPGALGDDFPLCAFFCPVLALAHGMPIFAYCRILCECGNQKIFLSRIKEETYIAQADRQITDAIHPLLLLVQPGIHI